MKVDVLGKKVKISITCRRKMASKIGDNVDGYFDPRSFEIHLAKDLNEDQLKQTLFHELCHSCFHRVGIDQVIPPELQEILCESLANTFHAYLSLEISKTPNKKGKDQALL